MIWKRSTKKEWGYNVKTKVSINMVRTQSHQASPKQGPGHLWESNSNTGLGLSLLKKHQEPSQSQLAQWVRYSIKLFYFFDFRNAGEHHVHTVKSTASGGHHRHQERDIKKHWLPPFIPPKNNGKMLVQLYQQVSRRKWKCEQISSHQWVLEVQ